jgi:hypothetical protein
LVRNEPFFSVNLVGGSHVYEGNLFATNPQTGVYGPVCDNFWSMDNVRARV